VNHDDPASPAVDLVIGLAIGPAVGLAIDPAAGSDPA
jgi:hypothetical protein